MRSRLLLSLLLIGGWVRALVYDLPRDWLATLALPLSLLLRAWRWRKKKKNPLEEEESSSNNEQQREQREKREVEKTEETKSVEEGRDEELSLLVLQDFYATQVYKGIREPPNAHCDMATGLVDSLLRRLQTFGPCCEAVFQGRSVGVGSMFEGWGVSRGDQVPVYDVLVVLNPPAGLSLDVELGQGAPTAAALPPSSATATPLSPPAPPSASPPQPTPSTPPSTPTPPPSEETDSSGCSSPQQQQHHPLPTMQCGGMARVMVRAAEGRRARSFSSRYLLHAFLERIRTEHSKEGLDYMLEECLMVDQYMEPVRLLAWLGAGLRRAWVFRGGVLKLSFWGPEWPCVMRAESTGSGRVLYVNVVPAVRLADSDVCVVARGRGGGGGVVAMASGGGGGAELWEPWFCSDEGYFLRCAARRLPGNSCHLMLLELLCFLLRPPSPVFCARGVSFLSSYHLKTVLLHLLLRWRSDPAAWDAVCLAARFRDALALLRRCLGDRHLPSFWVGNQALGDLQPRLPPFFRHVAPLNLFAALAQHRGWHCLALQEFNRLRARLHALPGSCGSASLPPATTPCLGRPPSLGPPHTSFTREALGSLRNVMNRRLRLGGGGRRRAAV